MSDEKVNNGKTHYWNKYVRLMEDDFGTYFDEEGNPHPVKRYTWQNHNKIEVQVINYGARITSIKVPNRAGQAEDIVLGFDDLAGYIYYAKHYVGAIIGRTSNRILNGTYAFDGKQIWLTQNDGQHHYNGGRCGFDTVVWTPYVNGNQLMLSYTSKHGEEGYPGDLFVRITFELTGHCEFKMRIEANCSQITPVDITNQVYFNLAGHEKGEDEIKNHILLLNANCYTPIKKDHFPSGEIRNVVHTRYDFQTPKLMRKAMGEQNIGFDQNYCINRGVDQGDAFVARLLHPVTGRILEIYSNQYGVNLYTADCFGSGLIEIPGMIISPSPSLETNAVRTTHDGVFMFVSKLHEYLRNDLKMNESDYMDMLKSLTKKLLHMTQLNDEDNRSIEEDECTVTEHSDFNYHMLYPTLEVGFLRTIKKAIPRITKDMDFLAIRSVIDDIVNEEMLMADEEEEDEGEGEQSQIVLDSYVKEAIKRQYSMHEKRMARQNAVEATLKKFEKKGLIKPTNIIPARYKDGRLHGKGGVIYRKLGAINLQTQNYPNALHNQKFPSPILKPTETYVHTITYKFWVQSGNPEKWLKRMEMENNPCKQNV